MFALDLLEFIPLSRPYMEFISLMVRILAMMKNVVRIRYISVGKNEFTVFSLMFPERGRIKCI